ncbi:hypothetical protein CRE_08913 [Caenorhabditis remanei]|uniref:Uncharacterized protein n=1 Tax=Caenorhabditis remanei TaxID=31234 RepID=E3LI94_CAERE|nr:hypothetical protein CRE_08913 [Caenorhabditis remanei]
MSILNSLIFWRNCLSEIVSVIGLLRNKYVCHFLQTSIFSKRASIQSPLLLAHYTYGCYCILFKTPKTLSSVKWPLFNLHFWCMVLDWSITILTVPILWFPALARYPVGILTVLFNVPVVVKTYLVLTLCSVLPTAIVSIIENRYYRSSTIPAPGNYSEINKKFQQIPNLPDEIRSSPIFLLATEYLYIVSAFNFMCTLCLSVATIFIVLLYRNMKHTFARSRSIVGDLLLQVMFYSPYHWTITINLVTTWYLFCPRCMVSALQLSCYEPYRLACVDLWRNHHFPNLAVPKLSMMLSANRFSGISYNTAVALKTVLQKIWYEVDVDYLRRTGDFGVVRLKACIKAKVSNFEFLLYTKSNTYIPTINNVFLLIQSGFGPISKK